MRRLCVLGLGLAPLRSWTADEKLISFVRPGLVVTVTGASIAADGTITVDVKVTGPRGLVLDREGITTPGVVVLSLIAAVLPKGESRYTAYPTRVRVAGGTGKQARRPRQKAPAKLDRPATHSIGVYANRNLTELELGVNYSSNVFNFVPAGGTVMETHDIIRTESCNGCHRYAISKKLK